MLLDFPTFLIVPRVALPALARPSVYLSVGLVVLLEHFSLDDEVERGRRVILLIDQLVLDQIVELALLAESFKNLPLVLLEQGVHLQVRQDICVEHGFSLAHDLLH